MSNVCGTSDKPETATDFRLWTAGQGSKGVGSSAAANALNLSSIDLERCSLGRFLGCADPPTSCAVGKGTDNAAARRYSGYGWPGFSGAGDEAGKVPSFWLLSSSPGPPTLRSAFCLSLSSFLRFLASSF